MLIPIAVTGFSVAFFHAAIPTHWLPFVMAARVQKWTKGKTLAVTAIAGSGHVLLTTILGVVIVWLGIELDKKAGHWFPTIAGGALIAFGAYYLNQQRRGVGHSHAHLSFGKKGTHNEHHHHEHEHHTYDYYQEHSHDHDHDHLEVGIAQKAVSDKVAILGLLAMLTFSPCEGFLPVYLSGISYGWIGFVILSAILALGTLLGMIAFTWLTLAGMEKLKLAFLEKYESALMGVVLCLLGFAVILFEH
jgi:ABC-type nickel/cobalt efflux system permease component RcnA